MTLYFLTPDYSTASGGVRVIYRHVDILNSHGIPAFVLHRKHGHRARWFENNTSVCYWDQSLWRRASSKLRRLSQPDRPQEIFLRDASSPVIGPTDFLVLPEIYGPEMTKIGPGIPKVILNQGCYLTFQGYSVDNTTFPSPYAHEDIKGILINSEDGLYYLKYVFPSQQATRFHISIDPNLFAYSPHKKRQICFTSRKNELIARQVVNILKTRDALRGFEFKSFNNLPQPEVAKLMQESALFLSFGQYEGFGLPPAEAMACGCVVIGFHAGGGREFMKKEFSFPIPQGEVLDYARTVEEIIGAYDSQQPRFMAMGKAASDYIHSTYTPHREIEDIVGFWRKLLNTH